MKRNKAFLINTSLCIFSILITVLVLEIGARFYFSYLDPDTADRIKKHQNAVARFIKRGSIYTPHPYLSYTPADVTVGLKHCVIHDQKFMLEKKPDTLRIACLGGSTTKNSYPHYFQKALEPCFPDQSLEIMNWGCQGWTIVESTLNYVLRVQAFNPDIVILHHGINDIAPRIRQNFVLDYSHYRKAYLFPGLNLFDRWSGTSWLLAWLEFRLGRRCADLDSWTVQSNSPLLLSNAPLEPETLNPYTQCLETIANLAQNHGSKLIFAGMIYSVTQNLIPEYVPIVEEHNQQTRSLSEQKDLLYIDAQSNFKHHPQYFVDQCHLTFFADEIKAQLYASAVAHVMNREPRVWITDDLNTQEDLSLRKDIDHVNERKLVVRWKLSDPEIQDIHIYVQVDGEKEQYLGQRANPNDSFLVWESGNHSIAPNFRNGPEFGHTYRFSVYGLGAKIYPPLLTIGPVKYEQESESS